MKIIVKNLDDAPIEIRSRTAGMENDVVTIEPKQGSEVNADEVYVARVGAVPSTRDVGGEEAVPGAPPGEGAGEAKKPKSKKGDAQGSHEAGAKIEAGTTSQ